MGPFDCEKIIVAEAKDYALATVALNPYAEAASLDLGVLAAVYCGVSSPVHGIYLLDSQITELDLEEGEKFLRLKDRKPWYWEPLGFSKITSLRKNNLIYKQKAFGKEIAPATEPSPPEPSNHPDWSQIFSETLRKSTVLSAPHLFAETKFQQANTRFYADDSGASYTYFHGAAAFVPYSPSAALLERQFQDAAQFGCKFFLTFDSAFPPLYERTLHEAP